MMGGSVGVGGGSGLLGHGHEYLLGQEQERFGFHSSAAAWPFPSKSNFSPKTKRMTIPKNTTNYLQQQPPPPIHRRRAVAEPVPLLAPVPSHLVLDPAMLKLLLALPLTQMLGSTLLLSLPPGLLLVILAVEMQVARLGGLVIQSRMMLMRVKIAVAIPHLLLLLRTRKRRREKRKSGFVDASAPAANVSGAWHLSEDSVGGLGLVYHVHGFLDA